MGLFLTMTSIGNKLESLERRLDACSCAPATVVVNTATTTSSVLSTPASTILDSTVVPSNTFYPDLNDIYVDPLRHQPPVALALHVMGTQYNLGNLIVEGDIALTVDGTRISLGALYRALYTLQATECSSPCVNGLHSSLCACVCLTGWTGSACDQNSCNDRGTWDTSTATCVCDAGYDAAYYCSTIKCIHGSITPEGRCACEYGWEGADCSTPLSLCFDSCRGHCNSAGVCTCNATQFGPDCEYDCSAAGVQAESCFLARTNLGRDQCAQAYGALVCVCGGGFNRIGAQVDTRVASCVGCTVADMDLSRCCAPDVHCGHRHVCETDSCCLSQTAASCVSVGCNLCNLTDNSDTFCTLASAPGYNCSSNTRPPVTWSIAPVNCSDAANSPLCSAVIRDQYLDVYALARSLDDARFAINSDTWPQLQTEVNSDLERAFQLSVLSSPFVCDSGYYIGVGSTIAATDIQVLGVTCGQPLDFWLGVRPPNNITDASGNALYYISSDGVTMCVAQIISSDALFESMTLAASAVDRVQVLGIPVDSSFGQCATAAYDGTTVVAGDVFFVMDTYRNLVWVSGGAPLPVQAVESFTA